MNGKISYFFILNRLKRKEECDTYLIHICRHRHNMYVDYGEMIKGQPTSAADESYCLG